MASEETEEVLIGKFVKLQKRDQELYSKIEKMLYFHGKFYEAITQKWETGYDDPERLFKAKMSVNPNRIIELAEKLRSLQEEYKKAHQELRDFESKHPDIARKYGGGRIY